MKVFNLSLLIATTCVGLTCHTSVASVQDRSAMLEEVRQQMSNCSTRISLLQNINDAATMQKNKAIASILELGNFKPTEILNCYTTYFRNTQVTLNQALANIKKDNTHDAIYLRAKISILNASKRRSQYIQVMKKEIESDKKWIETILTKIEGAEIYKMSWEKVMQSYNQAIADLPDFDRELIKQYCKNLKSKIINKRLTKGIKHKNIHVAPKTANKIKEIKIPLSKLNNNKRNITSSSGDKKPITTYISKKIYKNEGMKTRCAQKK